MQSGEIFYGSKRSFFFDDNDDRVKKEKVKVKLSTVP
jgi:hypothetical protein